MGGRKLEKPKTLVALDFHSDSIMACTKWQIQGVKLKGLNVNVLGYCANLYVMKKMCCKYGTYKPFYIKI